MNGSLETVGDRAALRFERGLDHSVVKGGWSKVANDPQFLVLWNVDPIEAHYVDGSRRTKRDEKMIADKPVAGLTAEAA